MKNQEIVKAESPNEVSTFISQAISAGLPVETMERLFSLREKVKAEQAKEGFVRALSSFQKVCPTIVKTKKVLNKDGRSVRYQFAPLDSIITAIREPLTSNGLSYSWDVANEPTNITAICSVTHELGHTATSSFRVPIDSEGYMTAPQKVASALTFAKRYSLCNALGISTGEDDTDATDVGKEKDAKSDKSRIVFLLRSLGRDTASKEKISADVLSLTELPLKDESFPTIVERLEILVKEKQEYDNSQVQ